MGDFEIELDDGRKESTICHDCGEEYKRVGLHWRKGDCEYPKMSEYQYELIKGLVMGDGYVKRRENSPAQVRAEMTNPKFLSWLYREMGELSASVYNYRTAEENAMRNGDDSPYGYNDSYHYITRTAPCFNSFAEWYDNDKTWPTELELTPTSLSILYVCDGTLSGKTPSISCVKEQYRPEYVKSLFESMGIGASMRGHHIRLEKDSFFETVGGPIEGFEYKWIESFMNEDPIVEDENDRV
jgi:hypothetical protein